MRILIVEDTDYIADLLIRQLMRDKHEVTWATGLRSAREYLKMPYDLAILDNQLGDGYGTELIPVCKAKGIPCCIFSGLPPLGLDVPTFTKSDYKPLLNWVAEQADRG